LPGGFAGVDIFFVLSGFLITTLLIQEFDRTGSISLRNFYMRRALRLGPALIALLIVLCLLSFVLYDQARARGNCRDALIALFYASNWVRVFTRNQLGLLAHTWSLSCEEQFYIVWPIILLTLLRISRKRHYVALVAAAVALFSWLASIHLTMSGASERRLCFGLDGRADTLMIGCILSVVLSFRADDRKRKKDNSETACGHSASFHGVSSRLFNFWQQAGAKFLLFRICDHCPSGGSVDSRRLGKPAKHYQEAHGHEVAGLDWVCLLWVVPLALAYILGDAWLWV